MIDRLLRIALWCLTVVLVAALTHFVAILLLPEVAIRDAYHRLIATYPKQTLVTLPQARPGDTLIPFRDPAALQNICFFDLSKAPLHVSAKVSDGAPLALAFRTSRGKIFYSVTDRGAVDGKIDIRLVSASQMEALEARDDEGQAHGPELRLPAPDVKGLIVVTTLVLRPSDLEDARARLASVTCQPEP